MRSSSQKQTNERDSKLTALSHMKDKDVSTQKVTLKSHGVTLKKDR